MKPLSVAIVLVEHGGNILLIKRENSTTYRDYWALPGGKIEGAEHPQAAAKRELYEETGIKTEMVRPVGMVSERLLDRGEPDQHFLFHIFRGKTDDRSLNHQASEEIETDWHELPLDDQQNIVPSDRRFLQIFVQENRKGRFKCTLNKSGADYFFEDFEQVAEWE